ncbi:metal-dependent hydrolase [Halomarina litorea]|uniref:metal-dependent hydrolase n=1 Tax=Halomarina litorea TaxID=2961595 RepID=UPI0020C28453|nr:metal-dependent hydrolase [Halomarina sp. BCD28]
MYWPGHWGVSLLLYAPVAFVLLSEAEAPALALAGGVGVLSLSRLPDVDFRLPFVSHRGITHTLLFALAVGAALGGAVALLAEQVGVGGGLAPFAAFVGVYGIVAHLAADVVTPAGVPLLWPLSRRRYSLGLVRASNGVANYLLLGAGTFAVCAAVLTWLR